MTVSDNTILSEGLGNFFKSLGRISAEAAKKLATNVFQIQVMLWKLFQILLLQLQLKVLKQICHHYQKVLDIMTQEKGFTLGSLYKPCYINGQKTENLSSSAPLEKIDLEQRLEIE